MQRWGRWVAWGMCALSPSPIWGLLFLGVDSLEKHTVLELGTLLGTSVMAVPVAA